MSSPPLPASYLDAHRYDGAVIQHDRRDRLDHCTIQPRDVALIAAVRRHKFLTAPQLLELWWPQRSPRAGQRRLQRLFRAGYLERFRPIARRGSFPWTYHLGERGHRLLQDSRLLDSRARYRRRAIYDYSLVLHELQLNAWALACRRLLGQRLLHWHGETDIEPPSEARQGQGRLDTYWSIEGLRIPQPRLLRPDTILEFVANEDDPGESITLVVEFDRTRRLDKNWEKFRRYDAFVCSWWLHTAWGERDEPPYVLFVCQDADHREQFLRGADHQLTGHRWHPSAPRDQHDHVGRQRILFAVEADAHRGLLEAWRLPAFPPGHPARDKNVHGLVLAGSPQGAAAQAQLRLPAAA
jgi:Replication-relaxation